MTFRCYKTTDWNMLFDKRYLSFPRRTLQIKRQTKHFCSEHLKSRIMTTGWKPTVYFSLRSLLALFIETDGGSYSNKFIVYKLRLH